MTTIAGVGIDLVDVRRFRAARYFDRVVEYILCDEEIGWMRESRDPVQFVASRFAAKEAVIKAFPGALTYHDVVIEKDGPRPRVRLCIPEAQSYQAHVSLSHEGDCAVACATLTA